MVTLEEKKQGCGALGLGILTHLQSRHGNSDTSSNIEMRHDVFRHLFKNKGIASQRKGWMEDNKEDFSSCILPSLWDRFIDHLGDGKKITFPVLARPVLHRGPKTYKKCENGQFEMLPRYYRETVQICFSTYAYTVNT